MQLAVKYFLVFGGIHLTLFYLFFYFFSSLLETYNIVAIKTSSQLGANLVHNKC